MVRGTGVAVAMAALLGACTFDGSGLPGGGEGDDTPEPGDTTPRPQGDPNRPLPPDPPEELVLCADHAWFDYGLGMCVNETEAFGPFTANMVRTCQFRGGGAACTARVSVRVQGHTVYVQRWARRMAADLRGDGSCLDGASPDASMDGFCVERGVSGDGWSEYAYGPFHQEMVETCETLSLGPDCFTQRWPLWALEAVLDRL